MIFNTEEVIAVLKNCLYNRELTNKDIIALRTLIVYLEQQEPKITFDEFNQLFKVEKNLIDHDLVELNVVPKNKFYVKFADGRLINDIMDVNSQIQEHIQGIAYSEFKKVLNNLHS